MDQRHSAPSTAGMFNGNEASPTAEAITDFFRKLLSEGVAEGARYVM